VAVKIDNVYRPAAETCSPSDSLLDAARRMIDADTGSLVVLDDGALSAVISERDVVRAVADGADPRTATVRSYATAPVLTAALDEDTSTVAVRMLRAGVRRMPVTDPDGAVSGIVSMRDLFAVETLA
jgi:CBS domain-containing protein